MEVSEMLLDSNTRIIDIRDWILGENPGMHSATAAKLAIKVWSWSVDLDELKRIRK